MWSCNICTQLYETQITLIAIWWINPIHSIVLIIHSMDLLMAYKLSRLWTTGCISTFLFFEKNFTIKLIIITLFVSNCCIVFTFRTTCNVNECILNLSEYNTWHDSMEYVQFLDSDAIMYGRLYIFSCAKQCPWTKWYKSAFFKI